MIAVVGFAARAAVGAIAETETDAFCLRLGERHMYRHGVTGCAGRVGLDADRMEPGRVLQACLEGQQRIAAVGVSRREGRKPLHQ